MSAFFYFSIYTNEEKKNLVKNLLERNVNLAKFMCDYYDGTNMEMNIHLMFLKMLKNSRFTDYFYPLIPNGYMTTDICCLFFANELKKCLDNEIANSNNSNFNSN